MSRSILTVVRDITTFFSAHVDRLIAFALLPIVSIKVFHPLALFGHTPIVLVSAHN